MAAGNAQSVDSGTVERIVQKENKQIVGAISKLLKDSALAGTTQAKTTALKPNQTTADIISFMPIILFLFIIFTILVKLKKDNVKLSDFFIDKDAKIANKKEEANIAVANANANTAAANAINANAPAYIAAKVPPQDVPVSGVAIANASQADASTEQSTSRLVVFISSITSVALACCIGTFYFYRSFLGESNVNLGNLSSVLYGLGLGVIPYGFNKVANAIK